MFEKHAPWSIEFEVTTICIGLEVLDRLATCYADVSKDSMYLKVVIPFENIHADAG